MNVTSGWRRASVTAALVITLVGLNPASVARGAGQVGDWLSPTALVAAPDGRTVYVACATAGRVLGVDLDARQVVRAFAVPAAPSGLALTADGRKLYVTCAGPESRVCVIDTAAGRITGWLAAGHTAMAPVLSPDGRTLYVCNRFNDDISIIDVARKQATRRVPVRREPVAAALTPDGRRLLVANHLPAGRADADHVGAVVSVIDVERGELLADLALPSGSSSLQDLRIAPDGRTAVVTHILARFRLPTTQVDRGWMNTNALTMIDPVGLKIGHTVLLDAVDRGAANPWGAAWTVDGAKLVVTHAGTHEVSVIEAPALAAKLAKAARPAPAAAPASDGAYSLASARTTTEVQNDLSFLVGLRERRALPAGDQGPRAVVIAGRRAIVANYFSDTLTLLELDGLRPQAVSLALGPKPQPTLARRGEQLFHDARVCFQGWQSCATCHPGDARVDALNWDLLNDGIGNPKNNKSLLYVFQTPPAMSIGVRESAAAAVRAGIRHILFTAPPPDVAEALDAYLQALRPVPSPQRVKGRLSAAAQRGERLFRSPAVGCATCHPGPLFTDLKSYDVGTVGAFDQASDRFDTPSLVELWRTAPYLHDGSAATLREVLTTANARDRHGRTSQLTADEVGALVEYLLSL